MHFKETDGRHRLDLSGLENNMDQVHAPVNKAMKCWAA